MSQDNRSRYVVSVDPDSLELEVQWTLQGPVVDGELRVEIPTWVPGDYTFFQLARDVFEVKAENAKGEALKVRRDGWQAWIVEDACDEVRLSWKAYGFEPAFGEPSGLVDNEFAILLGARYLHCPQALGACEVQYKLPERWKGSIHHPSGATELGDDTWAYPSYEILLDTPVVMGDKTIIERDVEGTTFYWVFVDKGIGFEARAEAFVDEVAEAARTFCEQFGSFPFEDYTFILSLNPANDWGLEHLSSTMCGLDPEVFTDDTQFAIGVRVCAHELFHAWNVRRLRPRPLGELASRLEQGAFTEGLWVAEGFTRYYEFLSCTRSGTYTPQQFISAVVGYMTHVNWLPAVNRVSAVDSSLSTYLTHSPDYPGRCNNCIDYYDKGMLIAFGLDARLRLAGDSLDAAFKDFYDRYAGFGPGKAGYSTTEVISFFEERLAGLGKVLESEALQPGPMNTLEVLEGLGFQTVFTDTHRGGLMFKEGQLPNIYCVLDDSPAGETGIAPNDVITTVNGYAYTESGLRWALSQAESCTLGVMRGQRPLEFTFTPTEKRDPLQLIWTGDDAQRKLLQDWVGREFPLDEGSVWPLDFYENFHGIETVL